MNFLPPDSFPAVHPAAAGNGDLGAQWLALHDVAGIVAALAGVSRPALSPALRHFPEAISAAGGWRAAHVRQGVGDICAILQTGIKALLALHARGIPAAVPARVLWDEFAAARDALMEYAPPGALDRRRVG